MKTLVLALKFLISFQFGKLWELLSNPTRWEIKKDKHEINKPVAEQKAKNKQERLEDKGEKKDKRRDRRQDRKDKRRDKGDK